MYMFELEEKIPGKRSKRFRYSEGEVGSPLWTSFFLPLPISKR